MTRREEAAQTTWAASARQTLQEPSTVLRGEINMISNDRAQVAGQADPDGQAEAVRVGGRKVQNTLTGIVAGIATVASATGMWRYFGDVLDIKDPVGRAGVFAVFELALLVSALRARRWRLQHGRTGLDDAAVWALAIITGVLAATDTTSWKAALGRLVLPLVAAFLFERAISAERSDREGQRRRTIHWRNPLERVAVRLGLASATEETVEQVDRARKLAKLARIAYRAQTAKFGRGLAQWRLRRRLAVANETLGLVGDSGAVRELQAGVALLFEAVEQTGRDAVLVVSPWRAGRDQVGQDQDQAAGQGDQGQAVQEAMSILDQDQVCQDADQLEREWDESQRRFHEHWQAEIAAGQVPDPLPAWARNRVNGHNAQVQVAAPASSAALAGGQPKAETQEQTATPASGPATDEALIRQYGDQLRTFRDQGKLSRYRVEQLLGVQKRQAQRVIDTINGETEAAAR